MVPGTRQPPLEVLRADWVFPVAQPPLRDGWVAFRDGRIVAVGNGTPPEKATVLEQCMILPGLVNSHTHLEFSNLDQPLGEPGMGLPDWIPQVVAARREMNLEQRQAALERGIRESCEAGVTGLGEIATSPWFPERFAAAPLQTRVFAELLGTGVEQQESLLAAAQAHLDRDPENGWLPGLSPHAPYTVRPETVEAAAALSKKTGTPLAMHLAESLEELELLAAGSGPLVMMLQRFEAWDAGAVPRGLEPMDYLERLAAAERALVIHGNYLTERERAFVAEHAQRMSVVYCARTHHRFGHAPYPLHAMLEQGIPVALGTDSRASNPDLQMLQEMRAVAARHPDVPPAEILKAATLSGATALGWGSKSGSLEPGKLADLLVLNASGSSSPGDPHDLLLEDSSDDVGIRDVWFHGVRVWTSSESL